MIKDNKMKILWLGLIVVGVCPTWAETEVVDGYTWEYSIQGDTAWIKSVKPKSGNIIVPQELGGYPVTVIGSNAFLDGRDIHSVVVKDGVTGVYDSAFKNCNSLNRLVLPSTVSKIGPNVFAGCTNITEATLPGCLDHLWDPESRDVKIFNEETFPGWVSLKHLIIADGSKTIFDACFYYFRNVETVEIPASIEKVGPSAFGECYKLKFLDFEGNAPICNNRIFDYANKDLVIRVARGSLGWDGNPKSLNLPNLWPHNNTCGRPIVHIGDPLPKPEPLICTNYVFETVTNHVYHHDVVTDMTAYYTTVTNVYVHYVNENEKPTFIFPSAYDTGFINVVAEVEGGYAVIPATWSVNFPGFTEKYGTDFSKALSKPNDKYDCRGNPMYVWQDYVAGTNPMDANDVFHATIAIEDGQVVVSHSPVLDEQRAALRKYTVYGKKNLMDSEWKVVDPGEELDYNFYRVTVRMKQSE